MTSTWPVLVSISGSEALFVSETAEMQVLVSIDTPIRAHAPAPAPATATATATADPALVPTAAFETAERVLSAATSPRQDKAQDITITASALVSADRRKFSVPKAIQINVASMLKNLSGHESETDLSTARALARGGPIGASKVYHMNAFFRYHSNDRRVNWDLWGGDAAWRWTDNILGITAAAASTSNSAPAEPVAPNAADLEPTDQVPEDEYQLENPDQPHVFERDRDDPTACYICDGPEGAFIHMYDPEPEEAPLSAAAVEKVLRASVFRPDYSGFFTHSTQPVRYSVLIKMTEDDESVIVRLYSEDPSSTTGWKVWEDREWVEIEAPDADDDDDLLPIDEESAYFYASEPADEVLIRDINPTEYALFERAFDDLEEDDDLIALASLASDEGYTEEERSKNASQQVRDKLGRFAKAGSRVIVDATADHDKQVGSITKVLPESQQVEITYDDGSSEAVDARTVQNLPDSGNERPFDVKGIQAQPRATASTPKAFLPSLLPPLTPDALHKVISDYQGFIDNERRRKLKPYSITPDTTDVKPLYLAQVDPVDQQAVVELLALVPKSEIENTPAAFARRNGIWVPVPEILSRLLSVSPPPVVTLDDDTYRQVLEQVDVFFSEKQRKKSAAATALYGEYGEILPAATAAAEGGLDRNRGNAERLRRYWVHGPGALKIRWGQGGDFDRCVTQLSKYLGVRSKGYCNLRHKEATGMWPAEHAAKIRALRGGGSASGASDTPDQDAAVLRFAWDRAALLAAASPAPPPPPEHTSVMIALPVPLDVARRHSLVSLEGEAAGTIPPEEMHITLAYLGKVDEISSAQIEAISSILSGMSAELAELTGEFPVSVNTFPPGDDGVPLWLAPEVEGLHDLRERLIDALQDAPSGVGSLVHTEYGEWIPHVTLAYYQDETDAAAVRSRISAEIETETVTFSEIILAVGPDVQRFSLVRPVQPEGAL